MTDIPDPDDLQPAAPAASPPGEPGPDAPIMDEPVERVRLGLVLTRGGGVLLERTVTRAGTSVWSLPSVEVLPGEPFASASVAVESSQLFSLEALPADLSEGARAAFVALAARPPATGEDGGEGPGRAVAGPSLSLPPALPGIALAEGPPGGVVTRSAGRLVLVTALVCAGGVAWVSGVTWTLATTQMVREDVALAAWLCGVTGAVLFGVHVGLGGRNAVKLGGQVTRTALALVLCAAAEGVLLLVASWFGGPSEARAAFWLWAFGALTLALALQRIDDDAVRHAWPYPWRAAAWTAAICASITVVFPPLRDALFSGPGGAAMSEVLAPSDDD